MNTNKHTEKEKTENFIYGLANGVIAYLIYKIVTNYLEIDYSFRDGININLLIDISIFAVCFIIVNFIIRRFRK